MARRGQAGRTGITHLRVSFDKDAYLGPGRADLLEAIAATQSISAAGRKMGMSYKRAWSLVQALNEGFGTPLVETARGGAHQGGAELTAFGKECLARYRHMQEVAGAAIAEDFAAVAKGVKAKK